MSMNLSRCRALRLLGALALSGITASVFAQDAAAVKWPSKAVLLEATRQGGFRSLPTLYVSDERLTPFTDSIIYILETEYGVPRLSSPRDRQPGGCRWAISSDIRTAFKRIATAQQAPLTSQAPTFWNAAATATIDREVQQAEDHIGLDGAHACGSPNPPYVTALRSIAADFSAAVAAYAAAEVEDRKSAFAQEQARIAEIARAKAAAAEKQRAEEQQRTDAERARIQGDPQKQQQQQQGRVVG